MYSLEDLKTDNGNNRKQIYLIIFCMKPKAVFTKHYLPTLDKFTSNSPHDSEHFNCCGCYEP